MAEITIDQNLPIEDKAVAIANLLLEIEHESFLLGKKLEGIVEKISVEMPKVETEIDRLEIPKFKTEIESVQSNVNRRHKNSQSIEIIAQLDKALEKVKAIQTCLKDADNWNSVPTEMEALFASNNFEKIVSRLQEAENSLNLISTSSVSENIEERKKLLAQFKDRARSLLQEQFVNCLKSEVYQDGKSVARHLEIISGPLEAFNALFIFKKPKLLQKFNDKINEDIFANMLSDFLGDLLLSLQKDAKLLDELFDQPSNAASYLVHQALAEIRKKVTETLKSMASGNPQSILLISDVYRIFVDFGLNFEKLYPAPARARLSIPAEQCLDWGKPIFDSFLPFQLDYETLERKYLSFRVENINLVDTIDIISDLSKRYLLFTSGVVNLDFHSLIDWFLCRVIDREVANNLIIHFGKDDMFAMHLDLLKDAISFIKRGNSIWKELDATLQGEILACASSKTALKSLKREYQVSETKQCSFSEKGLELVKVCQRKIFDALLVPVEEILAGFSELSCWSLKEPVRMMAPLTCVTKLGEYILTLPQQFDPYAQDETLSFSMKTLPMVTDYLLSNGEENENPEAAYDPTHIWIISAARIIEDCYAGHILKIPALSPSGMKQLFADTEYIQNVLSAIEIEPFGRMADIVYGLSLSEESLKEEIVRKDSKHDLTILRSLLKIRTGIN